MWYPIEQSEEVMIRLASVEAAIDDIKDSIDELDEVQDADRIDDLRMMMDDLQQEADELQAVADEHTRIFHEEEEREYWRAVL